MTNGGKDPLISKAENCTEMVMEITEEELKSAVKGVSGLFTVVSIRDGLFFQCLW